MRAWAGLEGFWVLDRLDMMLSRDEYDSGEKLRL